MQMYMDLESNLAYMMSILCRWHTQHMEKGNPYIPIFRQSLDKYQIGTLEHMYCFESSKGKIHKFGILNLRYRLDSSKYKVSNSC